MIYSVVIYVLSCMQSNICFITFYNIVISYTIIQYIELSLALKIKSIKEKVVKATFFICILIIHKVAKNRETVSEFC